MRLLTILTFMSILWSCEKQREQVEKFVFDNKQISTKDIHRYEFYSDGKIKTDNSISYMFISGVAIDSTFSKQYYQYNNKGQIVSISNLRDSTMQIKLYNDLDSLIAEYTINSYGDTTRLAVTDYKKGKVTRRTNRMLSIRLLENFDNLKTEDFTNYDTLLYITDLIYDGDNHIKSLSLDKNENVTEEIQFVYEGDKLVKSTTYTFLGDAKFISQTTNYLTNEMNGTDYITIGTRGDTISLQKTILKDNMEIVIHYFG